MPIINKKVVVPYTQEQMFKLVDRVEEYCEFLPHCQESQVISRTKDEVHATLVLTYSGLEKSFTTVNRLQPYKMIEIRLVHGPFKQLEGFWTFESAGAENSTVGLDLEFEFSNKMFALLFGPVFHQVAVNLVDAFVKRANEVYAKN